MTADADPTRASAVTDGSTLCLREVVVTCGTYADPGWIDAAHVLCLRQLPCDNPHHKPESSAASQRTAHNEAPA